MMKRKILILLFMSVLLLAYFSIADFAAQTSYYPSGYNLVGSTNYSSGSMTDLQSNNDVYMVFKSYQSQTAGQALYAHNETSTIGDTQYYLSKLTSADVSGTSLSNSTSSSGRKLLGRFVYSLAGVSSIPASTWTIYYRSWVSGTGVTCHNDVDIIIRQSNGTIRTTHATDVATSPSLTMTQQTLSGTYSWSTYTVASQTDYLEIDYYVHVTNARSRTAYLRIDDNTLGTTSQTRAANVYLPSQYTSEVEFMGTSDTTNWLQLVWTIDSAWTAASVSVAIQLYNYTLGGYPTSGDGYLSYTSSAIPSTDETKNQTITANPILFRDGTGNWRLKIKGVKSTTSPFDFRADFVKLDVYTDTSPPVWSNAGTNSTIAGQPTLFSVYWSDDVGLSGFIFGSNDTGNWANDTWTQMSGLNNWSNMTKTLNSAASWLSWTVWANDTSNNWNDTGLISFKLYMPPVASFTSSPSNPYTSDTVTFDASASYDSDGTIISYFWAFGDGTNAAGVIVTYAYANNGVYVATLEVTDNDTLTGTTTRNIAVLDRAPVASFTVSASTVPTGTAVNFDASASYDPDGSIVSYFWIFGDGTNGTGITTTHTYADNGTYTVTLAVTDDDGTTGTANATETVTNMPPVASFTSSPSTPYTGDVVTFNASASSDLDGTIVSYFWAFGDGANATGMTTTHAYVENGTYTVTLNVTDNDGATASTSATTTVLNRSPIASFTSSPATPYTGDVVTLDASSSYDPDGTIVSYSWTFGDGANATGVVVTHSYIENGAYTVALTVTDNDGATANATATKTILNRPPVAIFSKSASTVSTGDSATFNASSSYDPDGTIVSYSWTFGDGTNATGITTTHSYAENGTYTVTLTVKDNDGATATNTTTLTVLNRSPVASFTSSPTTPYTGSSVTFNASTSYDPDGTVVSYFWNFGDSTNGTGMTATHSYVENGTYTVTLNVTDNDGATASTSATTTVLNRSPIASFTSSPATPYTGDVVTLDASSSYDPDGTIVSYSWTFGDGANGTGVTATHSYADNGTYTVTLAVTDNDGATSSTSSAKTVLNSSPVASFTASNTTVNKTQVITFNASASYDPDGTIVSYFWNFGDDANATGIVTTHFYVNVGNCTVTLTLTDDDNATASTSTVITVVNLPPVADFTPSATTVNTGDVVTFNASSSYDPDGTVVGYFWTFGDGINATGVTVSHSYVDSDTYTVTLKVTDNDGATNTKTTNITILNRPPVASFTSSATSVLTNVAVTFDASSSYDPDGTVVSYFWTFGDGANETGVAVSHSYADNGTYVVILTVTDNDGAQSTANVIETVSNRPPVASFTSTPLTPYTSDIVTFNASASYDPDGTIVGYFWAFGDGANATGVVVTHSYVENGTYTVTLTVTDDDGSVASTSATKTVLNSSPVVSFTSSPPAPYTSDIVTFNASSSYDPDGTIVSYFWAFGDGTNATGMVATHAYVENGTYTVILTVTDNDAATASTSAGKTILDTPPVVSFTSSPPAPYTSDIVTFNASSSYDPDGTIVSYFWAFGDGTNATGMVATHAYVENGNYTVTLTVTDNDGSTASTTTVKTIWDRLPVASFTSSPPTPYTGDTVTFDSSASYDPDGTIVSYFWAFGDGTNGTGLTTNHAYVDDGAYTVTLTVTDNDGSVAFASTIKTVLNRSPVVSFTESASTVPTNVTIYFNASASYDPDGSIVSYLWTFGDGSDATGVNVSHAYMDNGAFIVTLTVTDNDGSAASTSATKTILNRPPAASFTSSPSAPYTLDTVTFDASSSHDPDGTVVTYSWAFGDGTYSTDKIATHSYLENGNYTVTLSVTDNDGSTASTSATKTILDRPPIASFTSSPSNPRTIDVVTFNASASHDSDGTVVSYFWAFGDGSNGTGMIAIHSYAMNGTYTVTLSVMDNDGSTASTSATKTILNSPPVASFTASSTTVNKGQPATFNASASYDPDGTIVSYFWTFGDGSNDTGQVVTHSYANEGNYTVTLTVTDNYGLTSSTSLVEGVGNQPPVASFTVSPSTVYKNDSVFFNASASYDPDGSVTSYFWTFGEGTNATGMIATYTYANKGVYTITLKVTDDGGIASTATQNVTVLDRPPIASFTISASTVPTGTTVTFNASSSYDPDGSIVSYSWTFGDGGSSTGVTTSHSYVDNGTYLVILTITDNDGSTGTTNVTVTALNRPPVATFTDSASTALTNVSIYFNASSSYDPDGSIASYFWNFGDGANATGVTASHEYIENGTYTVTLIVTDNDGSTASTNATKTIQNRPPVTIFTSSPSTPYTSDIVAFDASASYDPDGTIVSYFWTFGDSTNGTGMVATHSYVENGTYTVTLTVMDNDGSTASTNATKTVLNRLPVASFTSSSTTPDKGQPVTFNASASYDPDGTIVSYFWAFGDGTNAAGQVVSHSYVNVGSYTVNLTVMDNDNSTDSISLVETVGNKPPVAGFVFSLATPYTSDTVAFNASASYDPDGTIVSYFWAFGDGAYGTGITANHAYIENGNYTVTLTVTDNDGATASTNATMTILNRPPVASLVSSPSTPYTGDTVTFHASASYDLDGTIVSYFWTFGDGANGTGMVIAHSYLENGAYTVNLTVTDNDGSAASATATKTVLDRPPVASFTSSPSAPYTGDTVTFDASFSSDPDGSIASYFWTFGDGTNGTGLVTTHSYAENNNYTVTLTVTDNDGLTASASSTVAVLNRSPVASFTSSPSTPYTGDTVVFDASSSTDPDGTIISYSWAFGDGTNAIGMIAAHSYVENGNYTVTLTVTDSDGSVASTSATKTILNRSPVASFTSSPSTPYTSDTIAFIASSSYDPDGTIVYYSWAFGDGTNAVGATAYHAYAENGNYTVTLTVTDNDGSTASISIGKTVLNRPPTANFTDSAETVYTGDTISFNASGSYDPDGTITSYFWTFGDGTNTSGQVATHSYVENGTYTVTLVVSDNDGATATTLALKTVLDRPPNATFIYSPTSPIANEIVTLNASASYDPDGTVARYVWDFGDGNVTNTTASAITHSYASHGNYSATLTVEDNDGSKTNATRNIVVRNYPTAAFSVTPLSPGKMQNVTFDASATDPRGGVITSYFWDFGDGNNASTTGQITLHTYVAAGTYTATLTVADSEGLTNSASTVVAVNEGYPVAIYTVSLHAAAVNQTVIFNGTASYDPDGYIINYIWNFGDGNVTSNAGSFVFHVYTAAGNYTTSLTVTDSAGLTNTAVDIVVVTAGLPPIASFTFSPTSAYIGDSVVFNASSSAPNGGAIASYKWDYGDGSPSVNTTNPTTIHIYTGAGYYLVSLTVADSEGLSDTTTKTVAVNQAPVAVFAHSSAIINRVVTFDASASNDPNGYIVSFVWNFGDGNVTTASTPIIGHVYTGWGDYVVALTVVDNQGYSDTETTTVHIADYPTASFTFSPIPQIAGEIVTFDASSSTPNGGVITSYVWDFGDGYTMTVPSPIIDHSYTSIGNYAVTLTVTDSEELSDNTSTTIRIRAYPVASFVYSPSSPNRNDTVTFNASSSVANDGTIINYVWNFGDGSTLLNVTSQAATHTYSVGGNFTVTLTVTNSGGLNSTVSSRILVGKPPTAVFIYSPSSPIASQVATFNASTSYDPDGYVANYTWNFGDENTTTVTSPIIWHIYAEEGNYTVTLRLTDNETLTNTTSLNVIVRDYPTAAFTYSPVLPILGRTTTFDASSSSPDGGVITSYQWNFGDGNITTSADPTIIHIYSAGGDFTVTLTVADSEGLSGLLSKILRVRYPPVASFVHSPEPAYVGDIVTFDASQSHDPDGQIVNYTWDFGDGTSLVFQTVSVTTHVYTFAENYTSQYTVTLTVTDDDGVNSTSTSILTVFKAPVAEFNCSPDFPIVYEFVFFNASGSRSAPSRYIVNYTWDLGDGSTTTTTNPIMDYAYVMEGNYTVRLTVTDNEGLVDTMILVVGIRNYPTAIFEYSPSNPFVGDLVTFDASLSLPNGGVILSFTWDFGDGNQTTTTTPVVYHAYTLIGNRSVTLTVVDSEGLSSVSSKTVEVSPRPPTAQYTVSPSPPKPGEVTTFDASMSTLGWNGTYHPPIISYVWDFGDGNITTVTSPAVTHIFNQERDYVVTLTIVDSNGLTDQLSRVFHVSSGREDVDGDGKVDMLDISLAIDAFMTSPGHPQWDPRCDVNRDGFVDMADLSLIIMAFGTGM